MASDRVAKLRKTLYVLSNLVAGPNRDCSLAVLANTCLFVSAVLRSIGNLIESNRLARLQKWLLIATRRLRTLPSKYIRNSPDQMAYSSIYKRNQELGLGILDYSKTLRAHYSYITDYRVFSTVYTSVCYIPTLLDIAESLPKRAKTAWKAAESAETASELLASLDFKKLISDVETTNNFLCQIFMDLAVFGDHKFVRWVTDHSMFFWYWSSKFWFANIVLALFKSGTSKLGKDGLFEFIKNNRNTFINLIVAYHWGWDWHFLSDYQLSALNLANYGATFWSTVKQLQQEYHTTSLTSQ